MGNKHHSNNYLDNFNHSQWTELELTKQQKQYSGTYKKYRHQKTHEIIQKYEVTFNDQKDYKQYLQSFFWRLHQENIVNTKYLQQKHIQDLCSTTYIADVYLQSIPIRLSEVTDMPYPQNLYVLYSVLDGYSKIYHFLGYLKPKQNQICVDSLGYVKVWINSDLSKNYPDEDDVIETKHQMTESMMVNEVIAIISENTDHESQPISIEQYFASKKKTNPTFDQAKILIGQLSREYKTPIPDCFQSILAMYSDQFNHDSFERANRVDEIVANTQRYNFGQIKKSQIPGSKVTAPGQLQNQGNMLSNNQIPYPYNNTFGSVISVNQPDIEKQNLLKIYQRRHNNLKQSQQLGDHLNSSNVQPKMTQNRHIIRNPQLNKPHFQDGLKSIKKMYSPQVPMIHIQQKNREAPQRPLSHTFNYQNNRQLVPNHIEIVSQGRPLSDRNHQYYASPLLQTSNGNYVRQGSQIFARQRVKSFNNSYNNSYNGSNVSHINNSNGFHINNPNAANINFQKPGTYYQPSRFQHNSFKFLNNVNANRQSVLNRNHNGLYVKATPIAPIPVPVSRNNFGKIINRSVQVSQYPHPSQIISSNKLRQKEQKKHERPKGQKEHTLNVVGQASFMQNMYMSIPKTKEEELSRYARAAQTRTQTPLNFNQLESQILRIQEDDLRKMWNLQRSKNKLVKVSNFNTIQEEKHIQLSQQVDNFFKSGIEGNKELHYYTSKTQAQIDPQIARDLAIYSIKGQI